MHVTQLCLEGARAGKRHAVKSAAPEFLLTGIADGFAISGRLTLDALHEIRDRQAVLPLIQNEMDVIRHQAITDAKQVIVGPVFLDDLGETIANLRCDKPAPPLNDGRGHKIRRMRDIVAAMTAKHGFNSVILCARS